MNKANYSVEKMCNMLDISRSTYYKWLKKDHSYKKKRSLEKQVRIEFNNSKGTYGSPRIREALADLGIIISKSTVARIMRRINLRARPRRRFVHTTDSKHDYKVFKNTLNRDFKASKLNQKWVSDITYILTKNGWTYLTVIIDLADRMVVAWTLSKDMTATNTTVSCMKIALQRRVIKDNLIIHSDRGVQYCCSEFRLLSKMNKNLNQSMSRKGNCWDNAPAESFFKTLKTEWTNKFNYKNYSEAKTSIFDYIETWYNTKRKHSTIGYMSPLQKHYFLNQTAA